MEEICQTKAESFICAYDDFFGLGVEDTECNPLKSLRTLFFAFDGLGENGPYIKEIELVLNEHLLQLLMFEIGVMKTFFQFGLYLSITGHIFCFLFCGRRCIGNKTVMCIGGYCVEQYVRSNDKAFESWFVASLQSIETFQTQGLDAFQRNDLDSFWKIEKWFQSINQVLTHKSCKYIS